MNKLNNNNNKNKFKKDYYLQLPVNQNKNKKELPHSDTQTQTHTVHTSRNFYLFKCGRTIIKEKQQGRFRNNQLFHEFSQAFTSYE